MRAHRLTTARRRAASPIAVVAPLLLLLLLVFAPAAAQTNADCLMCHEDAGLRGKRGGATISVHVDPKVLAGSSHRELECVSCQQDLSGAELPHSGKVARVDCSVCHDQQAAQH